MNSEHPAMPMQTDDLPFPEALHLRLAEVTANCTGCGLCVRQCGFLQKHGNPQQQARSYQLQQGSNCAEPFACHLCGLCTALCPHQVDPAGLFLALRQAEFRQGRAAHREYQGLRRLRTGRHLAALQLVCSASGLQDDLFPRLFSGWIATRKRPGKPSPISAKQSPLSALSWTAVPNRPMTLAMRTISRPCSGS